MTVNRYEIDEIYEKYKLKKLQFAEVYMDENTSIPIREEALRQMWICEGAMQVLYEVHSVLKSGKIGTQTGQKRTPRKPRSYKEN